MGLIRIFAGKSKPAKKKPGWQRAEDDHAAWLARINKTTLFATKPKAVTIKGRDPVVNTAVPVIEQARLNRPPSLNHFGGAGTKPVARPDILYKHDPEMLARELAARERKFTVAPIYNKGGGTLITDEMMKDITAGLTRRR